MTSSICDYSDYDYKQSFWDNANRQYEHGLETAVLTRIFKRFCKNKTSIIDAGCGFGRLFNTYQPFFNVFTLIDYAQNLLDQAKEAIDSSLNITFYQQSLYELSVPNSDVILSIRTLHHLNDMDRLFSQFNQTLTADGILILDIPNKTHIKNRLKQLLKGRAIMNNAPIKLANNFFNYHPKAVIHHLTKSGFTVLSRYQVGLFRIALLKKIIPTKILIFVENYMDKLFGIFNYAPSVYIVAKKTVDNSVDNH